MHLGGPSPNNPHHDPGFVRATHELRESRAQRLSGGTLSPWERRIAAGAAVLVIAGGVTGLLLRVVGG